MERINIVQAKKILQNILPNTLLVPAILSENRKDVMDLLKVYLQVFDKIDFDIIDNTLFEGKLTLQPDEYMEILHEMYLESNSEDQSAQDGEIAPAVKKLPKVGMHFMVADYESALVPHLIKRIDQIFIHFEALSLYDESIQDFFEEIRALNPSIEIGLAIAPRSQKEIQSILKYERNKFDIFDIFQVMLVAPGEQGKDIVPEATKTITDLQFYLKNPKIKIDGAITPEFYELTMEQIEILQTCSEASVGSYFKNHARF